MRVFAAGVFDVFHIGHLRYLEAAKSFGDFLVVGISTDVMAKENGKDVMFPYDIRAEVVKHIDFVDLVIPEYKRSVRDWVLDCLDIDLVVLSSTYYGRDRCTGKRPVVYVPYRLGVASSNIKEDLC